MDPIAAAWYADPAGSGQLRYWDGAAWTTHLRPPDAAPSRRTRHNADGPDPYADQPPIRARQTRDPSTSRQGSPRLFGWVLMGFGAVSLLAGLGAIVPAFATSLLFGGLSSAGEGAVETTGQVTDLQSRGADCTPIASFAVDGETYTAVSTTTYSPCQTALGRDITVSYVPANPGGAIVAMDSSLTDFTTAGFIGGSVIFGLLGLFMLVGGFVMLRRNPAATAGPLITS